MATRKSRARPSKGPKPARKKNLRTAKKAKPAKPAVARKSATPVKKPAMAAKTVRPQAPKTLPVTRRRPISRAGAPAPRPITQGKRPGKAFRANPYNTDLDRNAANFQPLTPLSFLARAAYVYPQRAAVIHGERRLSWSQVYARCRRLASALVRAGVGAGDTVATMLPNEIGRAHV